MIDFENMSGRVGIGTVHSLCSSDLYVLCFRPILLHTQHGNYIAEKGSGK